MAKICYLRVYIVDNVLDQICNIVQKSDIFVLLAKGRITLLRHCLCHMFLSSFRSDPPIVLPTTKVTLKK